jgi:hypothetical protein
VTKDVDRVVAGEYFRVRLKAFVAPKKERNSGGADCIVLHCVLHRACRMFLSHG